MVDEAIEERICVIKVDPTLKSLRKGPVARKPYSDPLLKRIKPHDDHEAPEQRPKKPRVPVFAPEELVSPTASIDVPGPPKPPPGIPQQGLRLPGIPERGPPPPMPPLLACPEVDESTILGQWGFTNTSR